MYRRKAASIESSRFSITTACCSAEGSRDRKCSSRYTSISASNVASRRISEVSGNCTNVTSINARNVVSNATPRLIVTSAMAPLMADSSAAPDKKSANPPTAAPSPCTVPMKPKIGITHIIVRAKV